MPAQSEVEVDVLGLAEGGIIAADCAQGGRPKNRRGMDEGAPVAAEQFREDGFMIKRRIVPVHHGAPGVDDLHGSAQGDALRMVAHEFNLVPQAARERDVVAVHARDQPALRHREPGVERADDAGVGAGEDPDARVPGGERVDT